MTVGLVTWGRREQENSEMPLGGWARLSGVKNEKDSLDGIYISPNPYKFRLINSWKKILKERRCWYEVTKGKCIQGLLATRRG